MVGSANYRAILLRQHGFDTSPRRKYKALEHLGKLKDRAARVATVAAQFADDVDVKGRFPHEAIDAIKHARLLSALVPPELGGEGITFSELAHLCSLLGQHCASTAMIFAMHQSKLAALITHGNTEWSRSFIRRVHDEQLLLGSATTEKDLGGDVRKSICALDYDGAIFRVEKLGTLISYGAQSDAILLTARRATDSPASDQVMVVVTKDQFHLEREDCWNALGMRGTCSEGFKLHAAAPIEQILDRDFSEIAAQSLLPTAHLLWSAVWHGIASEALTRAQKFARAEKRKHPGLPSPSGLRLAEASIKIHAMRSAILEGLARFTLAQEDPERFNSVDFVVLMNNIKIGTSQMTIEIINHALLITGIAGYKNDTAFSLGRHMRDALSAQVMISNDRIHLNTSNMLLMQSLSSGLID
jgi:acyl-CoA dehydrogenase